MAIARTNRQEQVIKIRMNVVAERSLAFLVLIVLTSCGIPMSVPVAVPTQLNTCDNSMILSPKDLRTLKIRQSYLQWLLRLISH